MRVFTFCQKGDVVQFYLGGELVGVVRAGSPQMAALVLACGGALQEKAPR